MNVADKKAKIDEGTEDVLKGLEHLLEGIPDAEEDSYEDEPEDEVYRTTPWKGLDWVSKARTLNEMERYREAIEQCNEALSINPGDPVALFVKGEAYRGMGNQKKALECYTKAVRGRPMDEEIWYATGVVLKQMGKLEEALTAFEKATDVVDMHHDAWYEKAVVLRLMGRQDESRACLEKAFRNYPFDEDGGGVPEERFHVEKSVDAEQTLTDSAETETEVEERSLDDLDALLGDLAVETERGVDTPETISFDVEDEKVLLCTLNQSLNIQQIRSLTKLALVTCYKKVRRLEELGLLRRVKVEVLGGSKKRIGYYRTNLKKVKLYTKEGRLKLGIEFMQLIPQAENHIEHGV